MKSERLTPPWSAVQVKGRFQNIGNPWVPHWPEVLRWKLGLDRQEPKPPPPDPSFIPRRIAIDLDGLQAPPPHGIAATWMGHSTFLIQIGGYNFLTDPHFGDFCVSSPIRAYPRLQPPPLSLSDLPKLDGILLSHSHYDHLDRATLLALGTQTPIFCPLGVAKLLKRWGFSAVTELSWGDDFTLGSVRLSCLPAQHGSARSFFDRDRTLWCGWLVQSQGYRVYFLGDTGYAPFFAEVGQRYGPIDLSLIPIGCFRPHWFMKPLHLHPAEAVQVHLELKSRLSLAMHWGTFQLADDTPEEAPLALSHALAQVDLADTAFRTAAFGETVIYQH